MANFHVDSSGNLWLGDTSTTFTTSAPFYVTSAGAVNATSGTIGGISINSSDIQANYSAGSTGFKIDTNGDAEFNEVTIRVKGNASDPSPSGVSDDFIAIGDSFIYDFSGNLTLQGNVVRIKDGNGGSETSPSLTFSVGFDDPGFYTVQDNTNTQAKLYWSSGTNNIIHSESDYDTLYIDAANIAIGTDTGGSNEFIGKNSSGQLGWHSVSVGSHNHDSDYAGSSHGHDISEINNHSHSGLASQSSVTSLSNSLTSHTGHGYMSFTLAASSGGSSTISNGNTLGIYAGSNISTVQSGDSVTISSSALSSISQSGSDGFVTAVSGSTVTTSATKSGTVFTDTYAPISSGGDVGFSFRGVDVFHTSLNSVSDETLKTGITDLTYGLDWINTLRPISYRYDTRTVYVCENDLTDFEYYNSDDTCEHCVNKNAINNFKYQQDLKDFNEGVIETEPTEPTELTTGLVSKEILWGNSKENWGFSAQEIEATLPTDPDLEIVEDSSKPDGSTLKVLDYLQIIAPLVKAVQELSTQVSDLTARIEALEG